MSILKRGTVLKLVPEDYDIDGNLDNKPEYIWKIVDMIGTGGFSECYQAISRSTIGILKVIVPDRQCTKLPTEENNFKREEYLMPYRDLSRLCREYPESRKIYDYIPSFEILYGLDEETGKKAGAYIWMPGIHEGLTFDALLKKEYLSMQRGSVSDERGKCLKDAKKDNHLKIHNLLSVMIYLTECTRVLHSYGVYNLDLKPSNILVHFKDNDMASCKISLFDLDTVRICSNGFSDNESKLSSSFRYKVTDGYSAPELYSGRGDYRVDIYSIGAIMYKALIACQEPDDAQCCGTAKMKELKLIDWLSCRQTSKEELGMSIYDSIRFQNIENVVEACLMDSYSHYSKHITPQTSYTADDNGLKKILVNILKNTLNSNPNKRYDSCEELLEELRLCFHKSKKENI